MRIKQILAVLAVWFFVVQETTRICYSEEKKPDASADLVFEWNVRKQPLGKTLGDLAKAQGLSREDDLWYDYERMSVAFHGHDIVDAVHVMNKTYAIAIQTTNVFGRLGFSPNISFSFLKREEFSIRLNAALIAATGKPRLMSSPSQMLLGIRS